MAGTEQQQRMAQKDKCVRWRKIAIDQLGYTLNLVFTLTIATLAYFFNLLRDNSFNPGSSAKCAMLLAFSSLAIAATSGILCTLNRLWDFRGTARRACNHPEAPSQDELRGLGNITWTLFYVLLIGFAFGVIALAVALLLTIGGKLA